MIKIAIADSHAVTRCGLRHVLASQPDFEVVENDACNGHQAIELVRSTKPDVLVMELSMPTCSGIDAIATLREEAPETRILIFSAAPVKPFAESLKRQGADAYLSKTCEMLELVATLRTVVEVDRYMAPFTPLPDGEDAAMHARLSAREFQVFMKLAQGATVTSAARSMALSFKTVSVYRVRMMAKLGLVSNSDITYYALKNELIE